MSQSFFSARSERQGHINQTQQYKSSHFSHLMSILDFFLRIIKDQSGMSVSDFEILVSKCPLTVGLTIITDGEIE
jgi:hypothetical protein